MYDQRRGGAHGDRYSNPYYGQRQSSGYHATSYEDQEPDGCAQCLQYLMIIFNIIFLLAGAGICAGAIYILVDRMFISDIVGNELLTVACWLVIVGGALTIFISIFGCCGAAKNNRTLLFAYCGILCVISLILLAGGILALALRGEIGEWVMAEMEDTLKDDYGINLHDKYHQVITQAWDRGQDYMYCCAVRDNSWSIYRQSLWYADQPGIETVDKPYVPESCCKKNQYDEYHQLRKCQTYYLGPPGLQSGLYNEGLHYRGCYTAGEEWIDYYSAWIAGLGICTGALLILGIAFSAWMAVKMKIR